MAEKKLYAVGNPDYGWITDIGILHEKDYDSYGSDSNHVRLDLTENLVESFEKEEMELLTLNEAKIILAYMKLGRSSGWRITKLVKTKQVQYTTVHSFEDI